MISKKIISSFLLVLLLLSNISLSFAADNLLTQSDVDKILNVDNSRVATQDEILLILDKIESKGQILSKDDLNEILFQTNLENIEVLSFDQIESKANNTYISPNEENMIQAKSGSISAGWVLQGRWIKENSSDKFMIDPFITNASFTTLTQVAGYNDSYVEIYPGAWIQNLHRYVDEDYIAPAHARHFGVISIGTVSDKRAYFINRLVLNHNSQTVILASVPWYNH